MFARLASVRVLFATTRRRMLVVTAAALLLAGTLWAALYRPLDQRDILDLAYSYPNGGGYGELGGPGVPEPIVYKGAIILNADKNKRSYCSGFTFLVAMKTAQQRGLIREQHPRQVKQFQREWYGVTPDAREKQCAVAVANLGIGREIHPRDAQPGDFVQFWRRTGTGHSVIFVEWLHHDDVIVGFKFRSSQPKSDGVGDDVEYFTTSGYKGALIDPKRFYVARLNPR